jgi:hypothetical protein
MAVNNKAQFAVVGSLCGVLFGAALGLITGAVRDQKVKKTSDEAQLALPPNVAAVEDFAASLITLAKGARTFDIKTFKRLTRKLSTLIDTAGRIAEADPRAVAPSLLHVGVQLSTDIRDCLLTFYHASAITTIKTRDVDAGTAGVVTLEPLHRDMRLAHQVLVGAVDVLAAEMQTLAQSKLHQAFAARFA